MSEPTEEEAFMSVDLYLTAQQPDTPSDRELSCLFCHKTHAVKWRASINLGTGTTIGTGVCESCRANLKPKGPPTPPDGFVHVDDFIDDHRKDAYARFVLDYFRRSAVCLLDFKPFMEKHLLFCTYKDPKDGFEVRYRVTGASRFGDVWLTANFKREDGYDRRVNIADCSEWSPQP